MKSRILAYTLALGSALAQAPQIDIPYQKFVLPNGLTLLVHEDHKAPVVAVNMWYHVGSKNERPGKTGFAHLFEHLMFGGSEHVKMRYIDAMERVGATDLNGTTNEDRTNYFETVPTSALDYVLFAESDRMGHLLNSFDKNTLDLQRGVVQNEKRQGENQPYGVARQLLNANTYPAGHPYSWPVIGSMDDLNAASLDDVKEWFRTYYGPSNAVIAVAGDIDIATAKAKVEKYFGDIPPGPPVAHQEVWIAKMTGTHRQRVEDRVPQARLYKTWNIPQYGSADGAYLDMVSDVLSQGRASRLYKRLVYDDQSATSVAAFANLGEIGGQFQIVVTAKPGQDLAKVEAAVDEELKRFLTDGPTPQELERAKTSNVAQFVRSLQRVGGFGGKSDVLANGEAFTGNPEAYKILLQRIGSATADNLRAAAQRWLSDGVYILEVHPFPDYKADAKGVDRSSMPETTTPPNPKLPQLSRATLSNGLKVVLAERHELPLVNFSLLVDAGYAADQFGAPGLASLSGRLLTSGTKTRSALEISGEAQMLGALLGVRSSLDTSTAVVSALKQKLDGSLDLFADVILNPVFPQADFDRERKLQLAGIEREKVSPTQMAMRVVPALLYGKDHPYGNPLTGSGTAESVSKITREDVVKFHQTWFRPNNSTLIIVGDTTLAEITPKLEKLFSGWKPGTVPQKKLATVKGREKPVVYLLDRPGSQQSTIITAEIAPPKNNPSEIAIDVMNDLLGGNFGSRMNMNIREDKHWSYGVFSRMFDARGQSPYLTISPVQTDKTKESMVEVSKELTGIANGQKPISSDELEKDKLNRVLALPGSRETIEAVGGSIEQIVEFGFPDDYYNTLSGKIKALRTADVNDAARSTVHPERLVWVVVGDRAKIEAGIRELNIGEIRLIDADGNPVH